MPSVDSQAEGDEQEKSPCPSHASSASHAGPSRSSSPNGSIDETKVVSGKEGDNVEEVTSKDQLVKADDGDKGKEKEKSDTKTHPWQAVWSPPHNAYYFWNSQTNVTTWANPLQDDLRAQPITNEISSTQPQQQQQQQQQQQANHINEEPKQQQQQEEEEGLSSQIGIDPDLAFLDPSLYASSSSQQLQSTPTRHSQSQSHSRYSQSAKAKRQMHEYFDVEAWEKQRESEHHHHLASSSMVDTQAGRTGGGGRHHHHHPTKKEVEEFKERKRQRKKAKLGWLHT